jgi:hypothetical protein
MRRMFLLLLMVMLPVSCKRVTVWGFVALTWYNLTHMRMGVCVKDREIGNSNSAVVVLTPIRAGG